MTKKKRDEMPKREYPKLRAVGRNVLCRVLPREEVLPSGLLIVQTLGRIHRAEVLSCGAQVPSDVIDALMLGEKKFATVIYDPYRIKIVYGLEGWHGASTPNACEGDLFFIDWEELSATE